MNAVDPANFHPSPNLQSREVRAGPLVSHRGDDPDAPLNRHVWRDGLRSFDNRSLSFPEHDDRYDAHENDVGKTFAVAAQNLTYNKSNEVFASAFTMGETWPTQDDAHVEEDEGSLDFSLGRLDDSGTESKSHLVAHETIAIHSKAECRDGSVPVMCNDAIPEALPERALKTQDDLMTRFAQPEVGAPRLPNGIPSFVLAKVRKAEPNKRKVNDFELASTANVVPINGRSFVDQIMLSIFGADAMGAKSSKSPNIEKMGIQWIFCGESAIIPIENNLLDPSCNDARPGRADVEVARKITSSEHSASLVSRSDGRDDQAHEVAKEIAATPSAVATPIVNRHADLIDIAVVVDSPSDELDIGV